MLRSPDHPIPRRDDIMRCSARMLAVRRMARIGLLGGSFNPAHRGHRRSAWRDARARARRGVVAGLAGQSVEGGRQGHGAVRGAASRRRKRMARRARDPGQRLRAAEGTRYTVDTVRRLKRRYPHDRFIWLLGSDTLPNFHKWRDWRGLAREVPIAVIRRPGYDSAPTRRARWAGSGGSSIPRARRNVDGVECTGDHFPSPAARPDVRNRHPRAQPQLASPIAMRVASAASGRQCHCPPGDPLTERPAETAADAGRTPVDVEDLHTLVLQSLDDDQAVEVVSIPLAGKSNIADHMVIASGRSTRQVASMAVKLADRIKERFGRSVRIEGLPAADWVLIDADDVIVHLFRPEVRNFYNLERMWAFGDDSGMSAAPRVRDMRFVALSSVASGVRRAPAAAAASPDLVRPRAAARLAGRRTSRRTSALPRSTSTPARLSASRATRRSRWRARSRLRSRRFISRRSTIGRRSLDDTINGQSVRGLMARMLIHSDNRAADMLFKDLGGPRRGARLAAAEWRPGRARRPDDRAVAGDKRDLWDRRDSSTPKAMVDLLKRIYSGRTHQAESRNYLLG